ncbi:Bacterial membrane flanked domain protein [Anatilimnocola aggregata]|uniref:Bacterial membrane flanked domain protein n=1 Tax=Anatilimnocola aggregata TaxID=2528021 RepID=A0A517Y7A6_9BACT|nr:PH domain-containing protein [Anatilimnocola aggregata]QDU26123.1 Bacterial membrane flanked domain protein [Anatilimnocola aggregata]
MNCPSCQAEMPADALFCAKCGQRLNDSVPTGATGPAPTPMDRLKGRGAAPDEPETHLWAGGFSPKAMIGHWLLAALVTVAGIIAGVLFAIPTAGAIWLFVGLGSVALWGGLFLYYLYLRFGMSYELTSQRLVHKVGILSQSTNRIEVIDVDDVSYHQTFIERMLGVGTIKILSTDTSDPKLVIRGIDEVKRIANMIDNVRRDERRRRGMYIETV